jgi:hypothetical protein
MMTITVSRRTITNVTPITLANRTTARPTNAPRQRNFWTILLRALSAAAC